MHALSYLSAKAAPPLSASPWHLLPGEGEQKIRQYLVDNNYVETVSLAPNLSGTTIAVNILVLQQDR